MTIQVVNGYVCMDCADVALAKKDINPAHPPNSPNAQPPSTGLDGSSTSGNSQSTPAVTFGGTLSQTQGAASVQQPGGTSQTNTDPSQTNSLAYNSNNGSQINLYA